MCDLSLQGFLNYLHWEDILHFTCLKLVRLTACSMPPDRRAMPVAARRQIPIMPGAILRGVVYKMFPWAPADAHGR